MIILLYISFLIKQTSTKKIKVKHLYFKINKIENFFILYIFVMFLKLKTILNYSERN